MSEQALHGVLVDDEGLVKFLDQHWNIEHLPKWCGYLAQSQGATISNWAQSLGMENLVAQLSKKEMLEGIEMPIKGSAPKLM